jgi:hypothetical protein
VTLYRSIVVLPSPLSSPGRTRLFASFERGSRPAPEHNVEVFVNAELFPVERATVFYFDVQTQNARSFRQGLGDGGEIPQMALPLDSVRRVRLPGTRQEQQ